MHVVQVLQHQRRPVAHCGLSQLPEIMANGRNHSARKERKGRKTSQHLEGQRKANQGGYNSGSWETYPLGGKDRNGGVKSCDLTRLGPSLSLTFPAAFLGLKVQGSGQRSLPGKDETKSLGGGSTCLVTCTGKRSDGSRDVRAKPQRQQHLGTGWGWMSPYKDLLHEGSSPPLPGPPEGSLSKAVSPHSTHLSPQVPFLGQLQLTWGPANQRAGSGRWGWLLLSPIQEQTHDGRQEHPMFIPPGRLQALCCWEGQRVLPSPLPVDRDQEKL